MIASVKARYSNGALVPLEPLDLEEGKEVVVSVEGPPGGDVGGDSGVEEGAGGDCGAGSGDAEGYSAGGMGGYSDGPRHEPQALPVWPSQRGRLMALVFADTGYWIAILLPGDRLLYVPPPGWEGAKVP